jgi:putative membrane protein
MVPALMLCGGPARAGETIDTTTVLVNLHQSDEKEIAMGKLAQTSGRSAEVKAFGKTLVKDHTAADKKVMKVAKDEKIDLGSTPHVDFDGAVAKMAGASDFDRRFAQMMLEEHDKALDSAQSAQRGTSDAELKRLLTEIVPVLRKHRDVAQKLANETMRTAQRD